jgi:hypothetical protein
MKKSATPKEMKPAPVNNKARKRVWVDWEDVFIKYTCAAKYNRENFVCLR